MRSLEIELTDGKLKDVPGVEDADAVVMELVNRIYFKFLTTAF